MICKTESHNYKQYTISKVNIVFSLSPHLQEMPPNPFKAEAKPMKENVSNFPSKFTLYDSCVAVTEVFPFQMPTTSKLICFARFYKR